MQRRLRSTWRGTATASNLPHTTYPISHTPYPSPNTHPEPCLHLPDTASSCPRRSAARSRGWRARWRMASSGTEVIRTYPNPTPYPALEPSPPILTLVLTRTVTIALNLPLTRTLTSQPLPLPSPSRPHLIFSLTLILTMAPSPGKQLKHAVLCALAEQIYHHSGGDVMRDGVSTWFGRKRASLSASQRSSTSSRDPGKSASAAVELQPATCCSPLPRRSPRRSHRKAYAAPALQATKLAPVPHARESARALPACGAARHHRAI